MKLLSRSLSVGAGVAAVGVLLATSASAHGAPFTIKAGSAAAGASIAVTGTAGTIVFKDVNTNQSVTCSSAVLKGTAKVGTFTSGAKIAAVNAVTGKINNCVGPARLKFAATGIGTWYVNVTDTANGVSKGTISNIGANVKSIAGPACAFQVGSNTGAFSGTLAPGTVSGTYTNSTQKLVGTATTPAPLGLWNVKGSGSNTYCVSPSIMKQGDKVSFTGSITLKADVAANNPITVS